MTGLRPRVPLLSTINCPADVRALCPEQLPVLASEIRAFLVDRVSRTGGHLGPNLGVVELSIALHRVFDSPTDRIVFDTGHQAYVHKILTGRRAGFDHLRQADGLSGYPRRSESAHDVIENSHASTALSYADGLAKGFALLHQQHRRVVAVVGDGAMTGGMCWEALNNIGSAGATPVVIVLNDNGRSYAPTSGGLAQHLATLRGATTHDAGASSIFDGLGLAYLGPVDGHDVTALEHALTHAATLGRPAVVHCVTRKGKGYEPAEIDEADCMHAVGVIEPDTGLPVSEPAPTWTSVFADELVEIGHRQPEVVAVTAAMLRPTGLLGFAHAFPDRVFDVGIAEQHAVTSAAGLAMTGLHPVVAVYATFLNRAFDQVLMDVALHRLPVTFVLDRAGITGPDGPSHHGVWDLSLLANIPGLRLAIPRDPARLRELLQAAVAITSGPTALRFPKATAGRTIRAVDHVQGLDILHQTPGADVLLICLGPMAGACIDAAEELARHGITSTVVDPRWAIPINSRLVELAAAHRVTLTVEDGTETGGFGARLAHRIANGESHCTLRTLAISRRFIRHGSRTELLQEAGLDASTITRTVRSMITRTDEQTATGATSGIRTHHVGGAQGHPSSDASSLPHRGRRRDRSEVSRLPASLSNHPHQPPIRQL